MGRSAEPLSTTWTLARQPYQKYTCHVHDHYTAGLQAADTFALRCLSSSKLKHASVLAIWNCPIRKGLSSSPTKRVEAACGFRIPHICHLRLHNPPLQPLDRTAEPVGAFITTEVHRTTKYSEIIILSASEHKQTHPHLGQSEDMHCGLRVADNDVCRYLTPRSTYTEGCRHAYRTALDDVTSLNTNAWQPRVGYIGFHFIVFDGLIGYVVHPLHPRCRLSSMSESSTPLLPLYFENPSRISTNFRYLSLAQRRVRLPYTIIGQLDAIITKLNTPRTMKQFSIPESIQ